MKTVELKALPGDKVFVINDNRVTKGTVISIEIHKDGFVRYFLLDRHFSQNGIFTTKEDLIKSL